MSLNLEAQLPSLEWLLPVLAELRRIVAVEDASGVGTPPISARLALVARVDEQRLYVIRGDSVEQILPISTAKRGIGQLEGSLQTPLGWHRVKERIGDGEPVGMIFRARVPIGRIAEILVRPEELSCEDNITTRILWLEGLEPGFNRGRDARGRLVDSYRRYIYLHGTDEEGRIGSPASDGCIRLRNDDILWLFERVPVGTRVLIMQDAKYLSSAT
ncbi:MAG: L,D-transpeptidase [Thioalkalivibrionaceae bacterium]